MANSTTSRSARVQMTVEIDHPRNCDVLLQSLPGQKLRSRISGMRTVKDPKTGQDMIPADQSATLGRLGDIPGMKITVDSDGCEWMIEDPLAADKDLAEQVSTRIQQVMAYGGKLQGVPTQKGTLKEDIHRFKTLCRELVQLVDSGEAKFARGSTKYDIEDIDGLRGKYLLNPGSRVENGQPRFEADYPEWLENFHRRGN